MDIATIWDPAAGGGDWVMAGASIGTIVDQDGVTILDGGGQALTDGLVSFSAEPCLLSGRDLATAVLISLFTDAVADVDDVIPDGTEDPRGWWAGPIGSQLWLRARSKRTAGLLTLVRQDIERALRWLLDDRIASAVDVAVEWRPPSQLGATITISRRSGGTIRLSFAWAWETI